MNSIKETLVEFSMAVFSGRVETQFVGNVHNVSGQTRFDSVSVLDFFFFVKKKIHLHTKIQYIKKIKD